MNIALKNTSSQEQSERNNNNFISSSLSEPKLTKTEKVILTQLHKVRHLKNIYHSHETIARNSGCTRFTVLRAFKKFKIMGLINWQHRYLKTNFYCLRKAFFNHPFIKAIAKNMAYFSLALLMSGCWVKAHRDDPGITNYKNVTEVLVLRELFKDIDIEIERHNRMMKHGNTQDPEKGMLVDRLEKIIPLEEHGRLAVRRYTIDTIREMVRCAPAAMKSTDPWKYICAVATRFSNNNNLHIDYASYHLARERAGIDKDDTKFVSDIRMNLIKSVTTIKEEPVKREPTGNRTPFKLSEEDERRVDNKPNVSLEIANMAIDTTNPFMVMFQNNLRKTLREQGHVLDCDQNEAIESGIKELKNESEGICPERTPHRVATSWSQT